MSFVFSRKTVKNAKYVQEQRAASKAFKTLKRIGEFEEVRAEIRGNHDCFERIC